MHAVLEHSAPKICQQNAPRVGLGPLIQGFSEVHAASVNQGRTMTIEQILELYYQLMLVGYVNLEVLIQV